METKSFRPLSGNLIFQLQVRKEGENMEQMSFRPLSGNLIFQ